MSPPQPDALLFGSYAFLSSFLPFLLSFFLFIRLNRKRGQRVSPDFCFFVWVFAVYIIGVYHFTGAGTLHEGMRFLPPPRISLNIIPFSNPVDPEGYFLNIVLFLPLGLLVPFLWDKANRLPSVLGIGAVFSLFVEMTQLLNTRATDIDDLILNSLGTLIGFSAFKLFDAATGSRFQHRDAPLPLLVICILVPYLGRFFLYDDMGLARLLYGF